MNESMPSSAQPPQEARNPRIWLRVNGVFGLTDADNGCVVDIFPFQRRTPHESYHVGCVSVAEPAPSRTESQDNSVSGCLGAARLPPIVEPTFDLPRYSFALR